MFYPCSGEDWEEPLSVFGPWCSDFWFVDTSYFKRQSPDKVRPVLSRQQGYELVGVEIHFPDIPEQDWRTDDEYDCQPPPIRTEIYRHRQTDRIIRVHRHRRRGPSALRKEIDRLGVFFYRGDGGSEGGSGTEWLTSRQRRGLIHEVLGKLNDGGLIVTDGSNCHGDDNPYREFRRLHRNKMITEQEAVSAVSAFCDDAGRYFRCIGCLGQRYGPTLVWEVHRSGESRNQQSVEEPLGNLK